MDSGACEYFQAKPSFFFDDLPAAVDSAFLNWAGQKPDIAAVQVYARKAGMLKTRTDLEG